MKLNWLPAARRPKLSTRLALRLALLAPLVGGLASAQSSLSICQEKGGSLNVTNLVTNESSGTFGTQSGGYRDLELADRPGTPYQYSNSAQVDSLGQPGVLVLNQRYTVTSAASSGSALNPYGPWQPYTGHTSGTTNDAYLAVNGAISQATFLQQPVTLKPNTVYEVGLWGRSPHAASSGFGGVEGAAQLAITVEGLATGTTNTLLKGDSWERGSVIFNSGNLTSSKVFYKNISTAAEGNDFYVDDVYLQECVLPSGSMSGTVFRDNNANGVQDSGEPGIAGVTLQETDRNGSVSTVVTDLNGKYTFSNLPVLNNPYTVNVVASSTPLQGLTATTPTSKTGVTVVANSTVSGGNYGYLLPVATDLAVYKYVDLNNPAYPSRDPSISQYYKGDTVAYFYEAYNNGPNAADGATLFDAPNQTGQLTYLSWTCTASGGAVCPAASGTGAPNLTLPKFPSGGKVVVRYLAVVNVILNQLYNKVTITPPANVTDTNPANNTDTVYICAHLIPDLTLTKTSNGPWTILQPGATYTLTVTNKGTASTDGALITVEDLLPVGIGAAFPSGFSPAPGWTCTYSGEAEQGSGSTLNPIEAQRVLCTSTVSLAPGDTVSLILAVNVTPKAPTTVFNRASVGKSNDPDPRPSPTLCTKTSYPCAVNTTAVSPVPPTPTPTCLTGVPVNLLQAPLAGHSVADSATVEYNGTLISNAAAYTAPTTASGSGFIVDGSYLFNNGYSSYNTASLPTSLQLLINGTVYATVLTEAGYSGRATVTAQNGASLLDGTTALQLNRLTTSNLWLRLPASVTSITSAKVIFRSSSPGAEPSDDYTFSVNTIYGCFTANPKATVAKTVQNITAGGPVGTTGTGKPGEVLEYCITTTNTGNVNLANVGFGDNVPTNTTFKVGAYGAGQDIRVTYPAGATPTGDVFLTAAADADKGFLAANPNRVTVASNAFVLAPGKTYTVCFRATIG